MWVRSFTFGCFVGVTFVLDCLDCGLVVCLRWLGLIDSGLVGWLRVVLLIVGMVCYFVDFELCCCYWWLCVVWWVGSTLCFILCFLCGVVTLSWIRRWVWAWFLLGGFICCLLGFSMGYGCICLTVCLYVGLEVAFDFRGGCI